MGIIYINFKLMGLILNLLYISITIFIQEVRPISYSTHLIKENQVKLFTKTKTNQVVALLLEFYGNIVSFLHSNISFQNNQQLKIWFKPFNCPGLGFFPCWWIQLKPIVPWNGSLWINFNVIIPVQRINLWHHGT